MCSSQKDLREEIRESLTKLLELRNRLSVIERGLTVVVVEIMNLSGRLNCERI
jgi:hypothetical protein